MKSSKSIFYCLAIIQLVIGNLNFPRSLSKAWAVQSENYTSGDLDQAKAAIVFRDQVDRFLELKRTVLEPALNLSGPTHSRDAEWALESLATLESGTEQTLAGLPLALDDRIDHVLLQHSIADYRVRLRQSLEDEKVVLELLPAAKLRHMLPDLTGLAETAEFDSGLEALEWAQSNIPAPWAPVPENLRLSIVRATATRAERLEQEAKNWLGRAKNRFPGSADKAEKPAVAVQKGFKAFSDRMKNEVMPALRETEAAWGSPVGRERFVAMLRNRHMISETPEELLEIGRRQLDEIHGQIDEIARKINRRKNAKEVWEQLKTEHPTREELPQFAYDEMERALELLLQTGAVTIPENARTNVMLVTEGRTFDTYPCGGYGGSRLRGNEIIGRFMTSPPKADMDAEAAEARLRGNNYYWARVVAVHEIYPGHHLQRVISRLKARPMRRNFYTTTLGEGWGLYSEQMMFRLGFFPDDKTTMAMLMMRAWRAARIIIDVSLHLGKMTFDEAVQFLVDNVDMDKENATAEVRRYLGNPTRPLSYLLGFNQIERLRQDYMKLKGGEFTGQDFHDTLLSYGPIPIPLIRAGMLGEPLPESYLNDHEAVE